MSVIDFKRVENGDKNKSTHSKKLEWLIRDFIAQNGCTYYDDELNAGILKSYFMLNNNIAVEKEIIIREEDCVCITTLSVTLKPCEKMYSGKLFDLLYELNEINCLLDYGHFEYRSANGDIRFKTSYEPDGTVCFEDLDKFLGYSSFAINKYGERILKSLEE